MPLTIEWSPKARRNIMEIVEYIAVDDPTAAERLRDRLESVVGPLAEHPYLFRPGRVPGTREIVAHPNYIVVYRVMADRIRIVAILHAGRNIRDQPGPGSARRRHTRPGRSCIPDVNKIAQVDVCGNLSLATGRKVGIPSSHLDQAIKTAGQATIGRNRVYSGCITGNEISRRWDDNENHTGP